MTNHNLDNLETKLHNLRKRLENTLQDLLTRLA